jgi:hypothetical protein
VETPRRAEARPCRFRAAIKLSPGFVPAAGVIVLRARKRCLPDRHRMMPQGIGGTHEDRRVVALLRFTSGVQEVFAVTLLPGRRYPDLINDDEKLLENSFTVPDAALADVPAALRGPTAPTRGAAGSGGNGSMPRGRS